MEEIIFSYNNTRCHARIVEDGAKDGWYVGMVDGYQIYDISDNGIFDPEAFVATKANNYTDARQTAYYIFCEQIDKTDDAKIQELLEYLEEKVSNNDLTQGDSDMIFEEITNL